MRNRLLGACLLATAAFLGACGDDDDDDNGTGPNNQNATVRFVNTTGTSFDVGTGGTYASGNTNIAHGGTGSSCISVNPATPNLTLRQSGTTTMYSGYTPNFATGQQYLVVARGTGTSPTFTQYQDNFALGTSTQSGLRVINALSGSTNYRLFVGTAGGATTNPTDETFTGGDAYTSPAMAAGNMQVRLFAAGATTPYFDSGWFATTGGQNRTLVIADPATGSTTPRFFFVNTCPATTT